MLGSGSFTTTHLEANPRQPHQPTRLTQSLEHARQHVSLSQSAAVVRKLPCVKLCFPSRLLGFNILTFMQDPGAEVVKKEDAEEETAAVRWHVQNA
jgi:hypothetical protein